jgi:hypothetical protein
MRHHIGLLVQPPEHISCLNTSPTTHTYRMLLTWALHWSRGSNREVKSPWCCRHTSACRIINIFSEANIRDSCYLKTIGITTPPCEAPMANILPEHLARKHTYLMLLTCFAHSPCRSTREVKSPWYYFRATTYRVINIDSGRSWGSRHYSC